VVVAALVGLIIFVLPGFIASRIASGERAAPASLGDLELILRGLAYSLIIHGFFALFWTPWLFRRIDEGDAWDEHVPELVGFALAVLATAVALGLLLKWLFDRLEASQKRWALTAYHVLGGQDVRDGFDYIFSRRKREGEDFILQVYTVEDGKFAGRYGDGSYFGLSPRPHDLYLEEMWSFDGKDLKRPENRPLAGGWFAADSIRRIEFRGLPEQDVKAGRTWRFGPGAIREALREVREARARALADAAVEQIERKDELSFPALKRWVEAASAQAERDLNYDEAMAWRKTLVGLGGRVVRLLAVQSESEPHSLVSRVGRAAADVQHIGYEWGLWRVALEWYATHLQDSQWPEGDLLHMAALITEALVRIDDVDWSEEERHEVSV
jgi:Family of unknown function (DUF6338)